jgi:hypothetical protein
MAPKAKHSRATGTRDRKVATAVRAELKELEKREPALAQSGLAATALALARDLDNPRNSATSRSMCARALLDTLNRLYELAPEAEEKTDLDDLSARRATRIAGGQ